MSQLLQDVRLALRQLTKTPGFTTIAVLTLAVGIGGCVSMFTLVNTVLLRPLSHPEPERLVQVWERPPSQPDYDNPVSPANLGAWREQAASFAGLAASVDRPQSLTGDGEPEEIQARLTTADYFEVLGSTAAYGRTYGAADEGEPVVVLSHRLWQRRFGGDPSVLGRGVRLNGELVTVVGVLGAEHRALGAADPDAYVAVDLPPEARGRFLSVVGRLRPGVTLEQADAEMRLVAERLAAAFPEFNARWSADVVPLREQEIGDAGPALLVLLGAVGLLLLIACANLANLLLSRGATRRKEVAVRLSLGATRGRLIRQGMTEALVLALIAGVVGVGLAAAGLELLVRLVPSELALPRLDEVGLDARVAAFALGLSALTAALFGAAPALAGSAVELGEALREAMRGSTGGQNRLRRGLVVAEVALAVVLLAGAGLLARSVANLLSTDPGMRTERVLTMRVALFDQRYRDPEAVRSFVSALVPRLQALPGVSAAGTIVWLPLTGAKSASSYAVVGRTPPQPGEEPVADIRIIGGEYHRAMGIPLLRGRTFDGRDRPDAPRVGVINRALAEQQFPGEDPLGRRLSVWWGEQEEFEIVGVVGDVRQSGLDQAAAPAIYWPVAQMPSGQLNVVIRTPGDPAALAGPAAGAVREIDPNQPVAEIRAMDDVVESTVARPRLILALLGAFASASLVLAALGLFGVVSYSVAQRRQEIGVRVALGARSADVLRLIVGEGMRLTGVGLVLGLAAAVVLTRVMASLLHGVSPTDPLTLAGVSVFLGGASLLASWLPARRAAAVDPVIGLRRG